MCYLVAYDMDCFPKNQPSKPELHVSRRETEFALLKGKHGDTAL